MKRAVVTGGSGYLGSHIADELTRRGFGVTIFDREESHWLRAGQRMVLADLLDTSKLEEVVAEADCVFHLAALADLNAAKSQPLETVKTNILGTVGLLEVARRTQLERFVLASTVYVYSREGAFYRCSKQACENYTEEFGRHYGLPYTILRYGSLYGPRANETNGVYRLLKMASRDERIVHTGSPEDIREYIHVEDAAKLSVDALADEFIGKHLIVTGTTPMRTRDLFTMFSEMLGRELEIVYEEGESRGSGHYRVTPYAYTPRPGRKLTTNHYVDMGQGLLEVVEEIQRHETTGGPPLE